MRGKIILPLIAIIALAIVSTFQVSSTEAHGSYVEYKVEPQPGISVIQHGNAGLVEVTVTDCLTVGKTFAFTMLISSERSGDSDLSVRKNSGVDISSWFSLSPSVVDLPSDGTQVTVKVKPPVGAELDRKAVTRIQEIGDGPSPGGHHGVKVTITCVKVPPPAPSPTPIPTPGATPPPTALVPPISRPPTAFPETGSAPGSGSGDAKTVGLMAGGLLLMAIGGHLAWRRRPL